MIYVLDTNVVSDFLKQQPVITNSIVEAQLRQDRLLITPPVNYELIRGLIRHHATTQLSRLNNEIIPLFEWYTLNDNDWLQAAYLWAHTTRTGRQLSDVDLLLAAITQRLDATLVTSDDDFNALSVNRINWRIAQPS